MGGGETVSKKEDYLDNLLNSVSEEDGGEPLEDGVGFVESEDDIMNEFERELAQDDADLLSSFGDELSDTGMDAAEPEESMSDDEFLDDIQKLMGEEENGVAKVANEPALFQEEEHTMEADDSLDAMEVDTITDDVGADDVQIDTDSLDAMLQELDEEEKEISPETSAEPVAATEESEEQDLMDLLSEISEEDEDISDIGKMLKADEENMELEPEDEIGDMGMPEEFSTEEEEETPKKKKKKKKKKEKEEPADGEKTGFFASLGKLLFGEDEPEEDPEEIEREKQAAKEAKDAAAAEKQAMKEQKKKEKEELKQQKDKEKAEKKAEKDRIKKEKAEEKAKKKAEEQKDKTPPLPKVPVILISVMAASFGILIFLGSNIIGYATTVSQAKEAYKDADYMTAYTTLNGRELKEQDQELYLKSALMSYLQAEYDGYNTYISIHNYEGALDCLVRGVGRYELHISEAQEYGMEAEYQALESQIEQALSEQFGVSKKKAKKLYAIQKRLEYSTEIRNIIEKLGLE